MEIENLKYSDIPSLDLTELDTALKQYPWFSYLRQVLMERLYKVDKEAFMQKLAEVAVFLSSRKTLYDRINAPVGDIQEEGVVEVQAVDVAEEYEQVHKPKVVVVGGDFFTKEDLKTINPEEDMELKLRNSPFYRPAESVEEEKDTAEGAKGKSSLYTAEGKVNFDDLAFCTETLGHIYAQQGFYDKAIEVFSKLILLYPQKSAYFAALVNDLKNNRVI